MTSEQASFEYDHPVSVSAVSGDVLGSTHFVGTAGINSTTGGTRWNGWLHTGIDPLVLSALVLRKSKEALLFPFPEGTFYIPVLIYIPFVDDDDFV